MDLHIAEVFKRYAAEAFGLVGALLGLSFLEKLTVIAVFTALVAGAAFAVVGAPIIVHYVNPPTAIRDHVLAGCALILGLIGFLLAGAIHASAAHMRHWLPDFIRKMIEKRGGV
jgi:tellurite resistance protein TehA-like permease